MSDPIQITRNNYWQVNGQNHSTQVEAFQDAANQALAAPGITIMVQPPAYDVVYTAPAVQPPPPQPPAPPVAAFSATVAGLVVTVTDASSGVAGELWGWGDGLSTSQIGNQSHSYAQAGTYTITLKVTGADGTNSTSSATITVSAAAPPPTSGTDAIGAMKPGETFTPPGDA